MKFCYLLLIISILISAGFLTCDMDKGLDIIPWIEGRIFFENIDRVEEGQIGDVVVVVAPDFPPKNWTDIIKTAPIYFDQDEVKDTSNFKVPLNLGTYDVVAVLWKPKGEEWSFETISNILGVYTAPNLFKPKPVTIKKEDEFVSGVNIDADFGLVRYGSFIKGNITSTGVFNPATDMIILASFPMKPETMIDYLFAKGWDLTLPVTESAYEQYEYVLDVAPGFHKYIALFWRGKGGSPYDFKKIADLMFPDDLPQIGPFVPEGLELKKGDTLEWFVNDEGDTVKIDLVADFDKIYE